MAYDQMTSDLVTENEQLRARIAELEARHLDYATLVAEGEQLKLQGERLEAQQRAGVPEGYQLAVRLCNAVMSSEFGGITALDIDGEGNWFDVRYKMHRLLAAPAPKAQEQEQEQEQASEDDPVAHIRACQDADCEWCHRLLEFYQTCDECGDIMHNDSPGPCVCQAPQPAEMGAAYLPAKPEETGVGQWCAPGPADAQGRRWLLTFDDADKGHAIYDDGEEARTAFAEAEGRGWNCHLFAHAARAQLTEGADALREEHERETIQLIEERDEAEEWADKLAGAIAKFTGFEIGEHGNINNPWAEALEALTAAGERDELPAFTADDVNLVGDVASSISRQANTNAPALHDIAEKMLAYVDAASQPAQEVPHD